MSSESYLGRLSGEIMQQCLQYVPYQDLKRAERVKTGNIVDGADEQGNKTGQIVDLWQATCGAEMAQRNVEEGVPHEIFEQLIFTQLPPEQVLKMDLVCKRWRTHASDDTLWNHSIKREWGLEDIDQPKEFYLD
jgi:F-box associated protein